MFLYFEEYNNEHIIDGEELQILDDLVDKFISTNEPIDNFYNYLSNELNEGLMSRIAGGLSGMVFGRAIGKLLIKALGIKQDGLLYKILTSRVVAIAIGAKDGDVVKIIRESSTTVKTINYFRYVKKEKA